MEKGHRRVGNWILVPVSDIMLPKPGRICYVPSWWAVTENEEVLFFKGYHSPQCNVNRVITERLIGISKEFKTRSVFIDESFLPHNCSDY